MAMFSDIRTIPGLYGGGFGRVLDVQTFSGGRISGATSPQDALVRLERLQDPLQSFSQSLKQYFSNGQATQTNAPRLSGDMLTLLQQIDPAQQGQPLGPQLPPLGPQLPALGEQQQKVQESTRNNATQAQLEAGSAAEDKSKETADERRKSDQKAATEKSQQQVSDTADTLTKASPDEKQPFGPDLIAKLDKLFEHQPMQFTTSTLGLQDVGNGESISNSSALAALAAQAYASTLASANNDTSLTA